LRVLRGVESLDDFLGSPRSGMGYGSKLAVEEEGAGIGEFFS
jgi:hypothetical protein